MATDFTTDQIKANWAASAKAAARFCITLSAIEDILNAWAHDVEDGKLVTAERMRALGVQIRETIEADQSGGGCPRCAEYGAALKRIASGDAENLTRPFTPRKIAREALEGGS